MLQRLHWDSPLGHALFSLSQNVPFAKQRIVLDARASIKLASSLITLAYSLTSFVRSLLALFDLVIASTLCMKHVL